MQDLQGMGTKIFHKEDLYYLISTLVKLAKILEYIFCKIFFHISQKTVGQPTCNNSDQKEVIFIVRKNKEECFTMEVSYATVKQHLRFSVMWATLGTKQRSA